MPGPFAETLAEGAGGHLGVHGQVGKALNKFHQYQSAAPAAAGTLAVDMAAGGNVDVTMPAGNITVGATTDSSALMYPGMRLVLVLRQDAVGGRTVTFDGSFGAPPQPNPAASAVTTYEFVAESVAGTAATWLLLAVYGLPGAPPSGAAGGALTGSYPAPGIAAGAVGHAEINTTTDPLLESDVQMAVDAPPNVGSKRQVMWRVATGAWRGDPWGNSGITAATALAAGFVNLVNYAPIWVPTLETFDRLDWAGIANVGVGASFRLGLWADTGDGLPGALIFDPGAAAAASTNMQTLLSGGTWNAVGGATTAVRGQLQPGMYWAGYVLQTTPTTYPTLYNAVGPIPITRSSALYATAFYTSGQSGALPTNPAISTSGTFQRPAGLGLHVASRP